MGYLDERFDAFDARFGAFVVDILTAVSASGREAAIEEFSSHIAAVNPYVHDTEEALYWDIGYFEGTTDLMLEMDFLQPLTETDWSMLLEEAISRPQVESHHLVTML